jgi:hypothetical protein
VVQGITMTPLLRRLGLLGPSASSGGDAYGGVVDTGEAHTQHAAPPA